jgi:hypothetical protein
MKVSSRIGLLLLAVALCASCGNVVPSPSAISASGSPAVRPATSGPTIGSTASPVVPSASPPPTPSASPSATPPYRIALGDQVVQQKPGTIIFGSLPAGIEGAFLEPYLTWPKGGLTYEAEVAFGAFWGEPAGASQIRITLYRFTGGTLHLVWSDAKRVNPEATSYFDELVPFKGPGIYRLEVTRGSGLLAWGIAHMGPRCTETSCSGG